MWKKWQHSLLKNLFVAYIKEPVLPVGVRTREEEDSSFASVVYIRIDYDIQYRKV